MQEDPFFFRDSLFLKLFHYQYKIQHSIFGNMFYVKVTVDASFMLIFKFASCKYIDKDVEKVNSHSLLESTSICTVPLTSKLIWGCAYPPCNPSVVLSDSYFKRILTCACGVVGRNGQGSIGLNNNNLKMTYKLFTYFYRNM